jgi:phosphomannomutase/phosphoglucomutase
VATPDLRVPREPDRVKADLAALWEAHRDRNPSALDGIRVDFAHGWALARSSVTEPLITLRFEADTEAHLAEAIDRFLAPTPELAQAVAALLASGSG